MSYRGSVQAIASRRLRRPRTVVGQLPAAPVFAAAQQVTQGVQLQVPGIPGVSSSALVNLPARALPTAGDIMKIAGFSGGGAGGFPTDAKSAIEAGLQVAGQIAGKFLGPAINTALAAVAPGVVSAVSSVASTLGISQGLGTALPGIGNLVGLAVTALVAIARGLVKLFKGRQQCDFDPKCPDLTKAIAGLSPVDALPVIANELAETSKRLAKKAVDKDCFLHPMQGKGGDTYECIRYMLGVFEQCYEFARDTPDVMGLQQLERLIPLYSSMPTHTFTAEFGGQRRGGGKVVTFEHFTEKKSRIRDWTTREGVKAELQGRSTSKHDISITGMLARMQARRAYLLDLDSKIANMRQLQGRGLHLRFNVVTELRRATEQYVFNPSPEMQMWLQHVGGWLQKVLNEEGKLNEEMRQHTLDIQRRQQAIEQLPPAEKARVQREARIAQLKFLCTEAQDRGPACDELRQLQGQQSAMRPQASPAPAANQAAALRKLAAARNLYLYQQLEAATQQGNPLASALFQRAWQQQGMTYANQYDRIYAFVEAEANGGDKTARFVLAAANQDFAAKVKAAALQARA